MSFRGLLPKIASAATCGEKHARLNAVVFLALTLFTSAENLEASLTQRSIAGRDTSPTAQVVHSTQTVVNPLSSLDPAANELEESQSTEGASGAQVLNGVLDVTFDCHSRYHSLVETHHCLLHVELGPLEDQGMETLYGKGVCTFPNPVVTRTSPSQTFDATPTFIKHQVPLTLTGKLDPKTSQLNLLWEWPEDLMYHQRYKINQANGAIDETDESFRDVFPLTIPIKRVGKEILIDSQLKGGTYFSAGQAPVIYFDESDSARFEHLDDDFEPEALAGSSVIIVKGSFKLDSDFGFSKSFGVPPQASSPINRPRAALLAALLAYLALLIPGTIMNPESSDFLSGFGTLVGAFEALKNIGFPQLAEQAKLGGFAGAALAESFEIARVFTSSQRAGEPGQITAARLGASIFPDVASFIASAFVMDLAGGVALTAVPIIGAVGAGVVAAGGAAVITYILSKTATAVKDWSNQVLDQLVEK